MPPKDVERMANSVDPDQTALGSLIRIYTVCSDIHVPIFKIFTVVVLPSTIARQLLVSNFV